MTGRPPRVVLMGVSGSGKSTVGPRLAGRLGVPFADADDFHSPAAKARMAHGEPLDDAMRRPWLDRLHQVLGEHPADGLVLACSALTPAYRTRLTGRLHGLVFLALVAPESVLEARLAARTGHFAGPALLPSQLATFELDDTVLVVDASAPVDQVVDAAVSAVRAVT